MRSFADAETVFAIVASESPVSVDGYAMGEPKRLVCDECDAHALLDGPDGHQTTIDNLPHDRTCSQRGVASRYYEKRFVR